jgi:hypothetical protein
MMNISDGINNENLLKHFIIFNFMGLTIRIRRLETKLPIKMLTP